MKNRAFARGVVPNYPVTSNDCKHLIPEGGYGDWLGNHHPSYYHDGAAETKSEITGGPGNWETKWNKNWTIGYIMGRSEIDPSVERFGRGLGMCQNDANNSKASYSNSHGLHKFWSGKSQDDCFVMTKPMGQAYKSWVQFIGGPIEFDSESYLTDHDRETPWTPINPMGLTFSYLCQHEAGSALADGYGLLSLNALLVLMYSQTVGPYDGHTNWKLAELASPDKEKLTLDLGMGDSKGSSLYGTKFPGTYRKIGGAGGLHSFSQPNPPASSRSSELILPAGRTVPTTIGSGAGVQRVKEFIDPRTKRVSRANTSIVNGAYGQAYYEFSEQVKQKIIKEDWRPYGIFFKWAGYSPDAIYGDSEVNCHIFDANYIAYQPKGYLQGHKYDRFNNVKTRKDSGPRTTITKINGQDFVGY